MLKEEAGIGNFTKLMEMQSFKEKMSALLKNLLDFLISKCLSLQFFLSSQATHIKSLNHDKYSHINILSVMSLPETLKGDVTYTYFIHIFSSVSGMYLFLFISTNN